MIEEAEQGRFWWLRKPKYIAIFLRELTSVFMVVYVLLYLSLLSELKEGNTEIVRSLGSPTFLLLGLVILAFSLYHSVTWFIALQRVQPIKLRDFFVPSAFALVVNLIILLIASLLIVLVVFRVVPTF